MCEQRLKIAFVVDRFGNRYGGAEAYGVELMRELASKHDVTVFAREYDDACTVQLPFVRVSLWRRWPSWVRVLLFALRVCRLTRHGFDIVHSHVYGWCGDIEVVHVIPVRYKWRVSKLPWYKKLSLRISPRALAYLGLESRRMAQRPGRRTVAVSGLIAQQLRKAYGQLVDVPVIPPGVTPASRTDLEQGNEVRTALGWTQNDTVCLLVARNPLRKGLPTVLRALALLPSNIKLLVVGGNAAARDFVVKFDHNSLVHRVRILGETSDVGKYYAAADIYVHPTLNDSFGMAPLEAMSYGLPVVISPRPWCGFAQYVSDDEAMILSHPEDAEQLAQFIKRLSEEPALVDALRQGGAEVVNRHSWRTVAARYTELYRSVLKEKSR